jgi:hypothetical protein
MIMRRVLDLVFRGFDLVEKVRGTIRPRALANAAATEVRQTAYAVQERAEQVVEDAVEVAGAAAKRTVAVVEQAEAALRDFTDNKTDNQPRKTKKVTQKAVKRTTKKTAKKISKKEVVKRPTKKTATTATTRKGSIDRVGKDVDSPRARAIMVWLREQGAAKLSVDAALDGKKLPARVAWALLAAERAGSEQGLTANDISSLLSAAAKVEVFATNIGRSLRDEPTWFVETAPDGRSKRYRLTAAGKRRAQTLGG